MSLFAGAVHGEVTIARTPDVVYGFYRDFTNVPKIVGDVVEVRPLGDARYRWIVALPLGLRTAMDIVVEEAVPERLLRYRTSGPARLRAHWRLEFAPTADGTGTAVRETLSGPIGPPFSLLLAAVGKHPAAEVDDNLRRLRSVLEHVEP